MIRTTSLTSKTLKEQFPQVYEEFFQKYEIVVSVPTILNRGSAFSYQIPRVQIKQKLPRKIYCGLKKRTDGRVVFEDCKSYHIYEEQFVGVPYDVVQHRHAQLAKEVEKFLHEHKITSGVDISVLFESYKGHGYAVNSVVVAALAASLMLLVGELSYTDLLNYETLSKSKSYKKLCELGYSFQVSVSQKKVKGNVVLYSPIESVLPYIFANNPEGSHFVGSIEEFFGDDEMDGHIPLDFGIIQMGVIYEREFIDEMHEDFEQQAETMVSSFKKIPQSKSLLFQQANEVQDSYKNLVYYQSLRFAQIFRKVMKSPYNDKYVHEFLQTLEEELSLQQFAQGTNPLIATIKSLFHTFKQFSDEEIAVVPYTGMRSGGALLFAMPFRKSRMTFFKVIEELGRLGYRTLKLDYLNRQDGKETQGFKVEQYLQGGVFSDLFSIAPYELLLADGTRRYLKENELPAATKDLLWIDKYSKKLMRHDKEVANGVLVSQSYTCELLDLLFHNVDEVISNKNLPFSTYSKQKNQLVSKIIGPLQKTIKELLGDELPLVCSGGLYDFTLKLSSSSLQVGVVNKLFHATMKSGGVETDLEMQ